MAKTAPVGRIAPMPMYLLTGLTAMTCRTVEIQTIDLKKSNGWNYVNNPTRDYGGQEGIATYCNAQD
jgi:hypothetical protein